jgi:GTP-binding protein YchF
MNVGLIGLPQTGKKTLFRLLGGAAAIESHKDPRTPVRAVADVQDDRFDKLVSMYDPKKEVRARLELLLLPRIEETSISEGTIFRDMGDVDAFCHLVRVFEDDSVYHMWGTPDPVREIEFVQAELLLHDLVFIEKRLERLEKQLNKVKDEQQQKEQSLLLRFRDQLENEHPLRLLEIDPNDAILIGSYPLLTLRKMIIALNISDDQIGDDTLINDLKARFGPSGIELVQIPVLAEAEIALLETAEERAEFMTEMGIADTAMHVLTRMCVEAVGLNSFFTVGKDEVRQWFVRRGALAPQAAGVIHSDLERGFIRAELMKYDDLIVAGTEESLKAEGKYYVKGKDYEVVDGDILNIRFNV